MPGTKNTKLDDFVELGALISHQLLLWLCELGAPLLEGLDNRLACMDERYTKKRQTAKVKSKLQTQLYEAVVHTAKPKSGRTEAEETGRRRSPRLIALRRKQLEEDSGSEGLKSDSSTCRVFRDRKGRTGSSSPNQRWYRSRSVGRNSGNNGRASSKIRLKEELESSDLDSPTHESRGRSRSSSRGKKRTGRSRSPTSSIPTSGTKNKPRCHRLRDDCGRFRKGGHEKSSDSSSSQDPGQDQALKQEDGASSGASRRARQHRGVKHRTGKRSWRGKGARTHSQELDGQKRQNPLSIYPANSDIQEIWDFESRFKQLLGRTGAVMAPRQEQELVGDHHRDEEHQRHQGEEQRLQRGYISEDMISPVSLLRSDRFVKNQQISSTSDQAQLVERSNNYGASGSAIFTDASPKLQHTDPYINAQALLQGRNGKAPRKVRPDSRGGSKAKSTSDVVDTNRQKAVLSKPAQQSNFECADEEESPPSYDAVMTDTGQSSRNKDDEQVSPTSVADKTARELMSQSPLVDSRITDEDNFQGREENKTPRRHKATPPNITSNQHFQPSPMRPRRGSGSDTDGKEQLSQLHSDETDTSKELLSQSPLRPNTAPPKSKQFQPSPLKSRPQTAASRRTMDMDPDLRSRKSSFNDQLDEHIRAFQAQQELSEPESRISTSPITGRASSQVGTSSENWVKRQQLPDPFMVAHSQLSLDLNQLSLKSIDRLSRAMEQMANTMEKSSNSLLTAAPVDALRPAGEDDARSRSASPTVFRRPLLRFDVDH